MRQTQKSKVYFTKTITPEKLIEMYNKLDIKLTGNIGVKIHSGEKGNKNFLRPEFLKPIVDLSKITLGYSLKRIELFLHFAKKHCIIEIS